MVGFFRIRDVEIDLFGEFIGYRRLAGSCDSLELFGHFGRFAGIIGEGGDGFRIVAEEAERMVSS